MKFKSEWNFKTIYINYINIIYKLYTYIHIYNLTIIARLRDLRQISP